MKKDQPNKAARRAKLTEDVRNARASESVLASDAFAAAVNSLRHKYAQEWLVTRPEETDRRERLYVASTLIDGVCRELRIAVDNGKIAQAALDADKE